MKHTIRFLLMAWCSGLMAGTPFETFQDWVAGKIPVKEAIVVNSRGSSHDQSERVYAYKFGYQGDTFFSQKLFSTNGHWEVAGRTVGKNANSIWNCDPDQVSVEFTTRRLDDPGRLVNPLRLQVLGAAVEMRAALQAGMTYVDTDTLQWEKDGSFKAESIRFKELKEHEWFSIHGRVTAFTNGAPLELVYTIGTNEPTRVVYRYGQELPFGIPVETYVTNLLYWKEARTILERPILGADVRLGTNGYTPSMFITNPPPNGMIMLYTNADTYFMAFDGSTELKKEVERRRSWGLILSLTAVAAGVGGVIVTLCRAKPPGR